MDLKSIIKLNKYSSNADIDGYIKNLDRLSLLLDGSSLASITSFKFMLLSEQNFFKNIELLKINKINGFEKIEIKPSYKSYNIYNYGIDLERYLLSKQISLLNLDKQDENSIKYINDIFTLSQLYSSASWEKHFIATIISSTLHDKINVSGNKNTILETFSKNVKFFDGVNKLYLSDNQKFKKIHNYISYIPTKESYLYMIKNDINDVDKLKIVSQQNNFKNLMTEASYPYLFLNFNSFFDKDLKKEYFQNLNKEKFEIIKQEYEKTHSKYLLIELSKLSKQITE